MKQVGRFEIRNIRIVDEQELEVREGCLCHNTDEDFHDGDVLIEDFEEDDFGIEADVVNVLESMWTDSDFRLDWPLKEAEPFAAHINEMSEEDWVSLATDYALSISEGLSKQEIGEMAEMDVYDMIYGAGRKPDDIGFAYWINSGDTIPFCEDVLKIMRKEAELDD